MTCDGLQTWMTWLWSAVVSLDVALSFTVSQTQAPFLFIANIQVPSYLKAFHRLSWCLECSLLPDLSKSVFGCLSTSVLPPWKIYPFIYRGLSFPIYSTPSSAQLFNILYSKDLSLAVILWIMHLSFDNYLPSTLGRRFREVRLLTCLT